MQRPACLGSVKEAGVPGMEYIGAWEWPRPKRASESLCGLWIRFCVRNSGLVLSRGMMRSDL